MYYTITNHYKILGTYLFAVHSFTTRYNFTVKKSEIANKHSFIFPIWIRTAEYLLHVSSLEESYEAMMKCESKYTVNSARLITLNIDDWLIAGFSDKLAVFKIWKHQVGIYFYELIVCIPINRNWFTILLMDLMGSQRSSSSTT